jgi:hypothetical protein
MHPPRRSSWLLVIALFAAAPLAACVPAQVSVSAAVAPTRIVWIAPGVWVVENHEYPIYYADGFYWTHRYGNWYRSTYHDDGFIVVAPAVVPRVVFLTHRPKRYVRYRAPSHARVRVIERDRDRDRPRAYRRDHRRR